MRFLGFVANIGGSERNISINIEVRGKPDGHLQGALTICMENPEIPVRIQPVFCQWYNSIQFLFSVPKIIPILFNGHFSSKVPYKW